MSGAHKRGAGKGGIAILLHAGRAWPALPDRERWLRLSAIVPGNRVDQSGQTAALAMKSFAPNIGRTGRIVRCLLGVALIIAGLVTSGRSLWLCLPLIGLGVLGLFEALRGWRLARACGIKTRL